jgi:lysophospholipid acyltransferase (LPLAT)-like uncharacterized protein
MPQPMLREQPRNEIKSTWPLYERVGVWVYHTIIPWIVYFLVTLLTSTYRWRQVVSRELLELMSSGKPFAVAIWHSDMLLCQSLGKRLGWTNRTVIMVALNQAGEVETRILKRLGYHVVRGSEKRRGKEALEDMKDILNQGAIAAIVVDGPLGPAREVKAGVVELARFCRVPIVPLVFLPGNEWKVPTWDRTRIPKPFSRCVTTTTVPITVPPVLDESRFEEAKAEVKAVLMDLEKRTIPWREALNIDIELLSLFAVRHAAVRIIDTASGPNPGRRLTKDRAAVERILGEMKTIMAELGKVGKKYYESMRAEIDWRRIGQMRAIIRDACRRRNPRDVGTVVEAIIPELCAMVDEIVRKVPLSATDAPTGGGDG